MRTIGGKLPADSTLTAIDDEDDTPPVPTASSQPWRRLERWVKRGVLTFVSAWIELIFWLSSGLNGRMLPTRKALNVMIATVITFGLVFSLVGSAATAYGDYTAVRGLASDGLTALKRIPADLGLAGAASPAPTRAQMQQAVQADIATALQDFQALHDRLAHPDLILSAAATSGHISQILTSAYQLSNVALDSVHIAQNLSDGLVALASVVTSSPLTGDTTASAATGQGLTLADIQGIKAGLSRSLPYLTDLIQRVQTTPTATLFAALSAKQRAEVTPLLSLLPQIPAALPFVTRFLDVAPAALGITQPTAYLLMTMDSAEMRPSGGFQGNYGVIGVNSGHVGAISLQDVYLLDKPYDQSATGAESQPPSLYSSWWPTSFLPWGLRDANLSADFPTSAQYDLAQLQAEGGDVLPVTDSNGQVTGSTPTTVTGVIAIEPKLIEQIIALTGPITIGAPYNVTVTAANLESQIHYFQLTNAGRSTGTEAGSGQQLSSTNKRFTALLAHALEDQIKHMPKANLLQLAHTMLNDLQTRDIQMYFTDPGLEQMLQDYHATAALATGATDALMIDDANISGNKGSVYLQEHVNDTIQLDARGGATHTLTITYDWTAPPIEDATDATAIYNILYNADTINDFGLFYRQYVRIYTANQPDVLGSSGWQFGAIETTQSDFVGRGMIGAHYILHADTTTQPVTWIVPPVTVSWHVDHVFTSGQPYQLNLQHQAGTTPDYTITVLAPDCGNASSTTAATPTPLTTAQAQGVDKTITVSVPACGKK